MQEKEKQCKQSNKLFLLIISVAKNLYLSLPVSRIAYFSYLPFGSSFKFWHHRMTFKFPFMTLQVAQNLWDYDYAFLSEVVLLFLSNSIDRPAEHCSLSFLFYSYYCWQKYDSEKCMREHYCNARTNGLSIAPQERSDRDSKASALLVAPVTRIWAEFLSVSWLWQSHQKHFCFIPVVLLRVQQTRSKIMKVALLT